MPSSGCSRWPCSRALRAGAAAGPQRRRRRPSLQPQAVLDAAPGVELDYLALAAPDLGPAPESGEARLLVAAQGRDAPG